MKQTLLHLFDNIKESFSIFSSKNGFKLSASFSFYALLSIGPMLLLLIYFVGFFFGKSAVKGDLFNELNNFLGEDVAQQISTIVENISLSGGGTIALIIGFLTLAFTATTMFNDMKDSINHLWKVEEEEMDGAKAAALDLLKTRLRFLGVIASLALLLAISFILSGAVLYFEHFIDDYFSVGTLFLVKIISFVLNFALITGVFVIIFRVIPTPDFNWKKILKGAIYTAILFTIGRFLIGFYLETTSAGSVYGAAGTLVVLMLWIYYSAAIMYLGASFVKVLTDSNRN